MTKHRGLARVATDFLLNLIACNLGPKLKTTPGSEISQWSDSASGPLADVINVVANFRFTGDNRDHHQMQRSLPSAGKARIVDALPYPLAGIGACSTPSRTRA